MSYEIFQLPKQVLLAGAVVKPSWRVSFFLSGLTTPTPVYAEAALTTPISQPVQADISGTLPVVYLDQNISYKASVYDQFDVLQYTIDPVNSSALTQAGIGAVLYPRTAAEIAAGVTPTNYAYPPLNLRRYGGAPGAGNNTSAMDQAEAVIAQLGSGIILLDTAGEWRMNWTCTTRGVFVQGQIGAAEYDLYCVRPYNIATGPAITFGDGVSRYYYNGLINVHMSGTDGTGGADRQVSKSASHCLLLKGGILNFLALNCWFYNGIRTVSLEPSATQPVSQTTFLGGGARNDLWDSASARTIYGKRLADPGYYTDNVFIRFKLNGPGDHTSNPTNGYLAEFDGTGSPGMVAEFTDCYADIQYDFTSKGTVCHGIKLTSAQIKCKGLQLDPGTTAACIVETTDAIGSDITRYIVGELRHGGQIFRYSGGGGTSVTMSVDSEVFWYRQRMSTPFITGLSTFTTLADPYDVAGTAPYIDTDSATGPVTINRSAFSVKTAGKGLRVAEGSNACQGIAVLVAGTKVVTTTAVTANSRIFLTSNADGGTPGFQRVSARTAGTSFTITSSNAADTSTIAWEIFEPA